MRYDADTPLGDFGPEELALNDWVEDTGPYLTLPADTESDGFEDEE